MHDIAFGGPAGASWARPIAGVTATQSPHNGFVEAFLRFGTPGLVLFGALLVALWVRRRSASTEGSLTPNAVGLLMIAQALYAVAYALGPVQGLVLGVLISTTSLVGSRAEATTPRLGATRSSRRVIVAHR